MIKGLIFDLDGTLLNTIDDLNNSVNDTYAYFGKETRNKPEETMAMVGHGMRNLIVQMFPGEDEEHIEKALSVFLGYYDKQYAVCTRPYEGIAEMVDALIAEGYKVGVNSNKNHNYTAHLIKQHFPKIPEEYVTGVRPGDKTKPDPENVNRVIGEMGLEKNEVLYVGDSPTDYKTAINAGTEFVGVSWGYRSKDVIINAGAKTVVDSPEELLRYVRKNEI